MRATVNRVVALALALGGLVFVGLLGGIGSAELTDDPPAINPYQSTQEEAPAPPATPAPALTPAPPPPRDMIIRDFAFNPGDVTVPAGTTINFINMESGVSHTSTSGDGVWDSGTLRPEDSFPFTFDTAGTFSFANRASATSTLR